MTHHDIPMDTPAEELFPQFQRLQSMVSEEVADLTDRQLDWWSDRWEWSKWSIRQQVGHIGTVAPGWLLRQWGDQLFPEGTSELGELAEYSRSPNGSWLDEEGYTDMPTLLRKVGHGMNLARHVLSKETVGSMRAKETARPDTPPHWSRFIDCHPTGVRWHPTEPNFTYLTLEATFRHLYYEVITHLYNVQRLKRAQGLNGVLELPFEGYWAHPDWDRSEPRPAISWREQPMPDERVAMNFSFAPRSRLEGQAPVVLDDGHDRVTVALKPFPDYHEAAKLLSTATLAKSDSKRGKQDGK